MNILYDVVLSYAAYTAIVAVVFSAALSFLMSKDEISARLRTGVWKKATEITVKSDDQPIVAG